MSDASHVIAYTTFSDRTEAVAMARSVVERQLAACAQVHEATSIRPTNSQVLESAEFILAMETAGPMIQALKAHVLTGHSSELPEFVVVPIVAAHDKYLGWIDDYVNEGRARQDSGESPNPVS